MTRNENEQSKYWLCPSTMDFAARHILRTGMHAVKGTNGTKGARLKLHINMMKLLAKFIRNDDSFAPRMRKTIYMSINAV